MAAPTEIRPRAIPTVSCANALLEQLPGSSLVKVVEFLEALSHEALQVSETQSPQVSEAALLQIIQRRLSPEEQERLAYLRQQNEAGAITETEYQELLMYVDRVERQDSDRAEALIQLARLRQVDLKVLVNEFLPARSNAA
ncbi:hypothetical protein [Merismopedia glauca]|uniref:STAS/SEC14 domain-containing protein n=1 Tax=Merismopedia glauca CCAP 1448/3 TaxID=1296344 RepID=A0A2T1C9W4_9CYAN|nr:hypothetical protein [Merismopedia glauca]PSB04958.1 hypothetical protein C7B64_01670 [Merismopedia glauca CCAP 1448/3]